MAQESNEVDFFDGPAMVKHMKELCCANDAALKDFCVLLNLCDSESAHQWLHSCLLKLRHKLEFKAYNLQHGKYGVIAHGTMSVVEKNFVKPLLNMMEEQYAASFGLAERKQGEEQAAWCARADKALRKATEALDDDEKKQPTPHDIAMMQQMQRRQQMAQIYPNGPDAMVLHLHKLCVANEPENDPEKKDVCVLINLCKNDDLFGYEPDPIVVTSAESRYRPPEHPDKTVFKACQKLGYKYFKLDHHQYAVIAHGGADRVKTGLRKQLELLLVRYVVSYGVSLRIKGDDWKSWCGRAQKAFNQGIEEDHLRYLSESLQNVSPRAINLERVLSITSDDDDPILCVPQMDDAALPALLEQLIEVTNWAHALIDRVEVPYGRFKTISKFYNAFREGKNLCRVLEAVNDGASILDYGRAEREFYWKFWKWGCEKMDGVDERFVIDMATFDSVAAERGVNIACVYLLCNLYAIHIAASGKKVVHLKGGKQMLRKPLECGKQTNTSSTNQWLAQFVREQSGNQTYTYIGGMKQRKMHGFGRLVFDGGEYIGQFADGRMHGWGQWTRQAR